MVKHSPLRLWGAHSGEPKSNDKRSGFSKMQREIDELRRATAETTGGSGFWGVRYQVKDVKRSIKFYTRQLGFELDHEHLPEFASVSLGELKILLSGPGASGSRPMKDGRTQEPGGWNRVVLRVKNLEEWFATLQKQNVSFRNEMETGPTGRQIQLEDPDGNAIELFEPAEHPPTKP
jgi:glyoxylase I family protein